MGFVIMRFLVIMFLVVLAFALCIFLMIRDETANYQNLGFAIVTVFRTFLGDNNFPDTYENAAAIVMLVLCAIVEFVLLQNLLIATMTHAYQKVVQDVETKFILDKSSAIHKIMLVQGSSRNSDWEYLVRRLFFQKSSGIPGVMTGDSFTEEDLRKEPWYYGHILSVKKIQDTQSRDDKMSSDIARLEQDMKDMAVGLKGINKKVTRLSMAQRPPEGKEKRESVLLS